MWETWLIEFLKGIAKLFLNPLFYYGFIVTFLLGVWRIRRERRDFHTKIHSTYSEMKEYVAASLLAGLLISIVTVISGVVVPVGFLYIAGVLMVGASLTTFVRLLSPAYTVGFSFFAVLALAGRSGDYGAFVNKLLGSITEMVYPAIAILTGLLLLVEGILINRRGANVTSPQLEKSNRGLMIGSHKGQKVWLVPVLLFMPAGALSAPIDWWPVFSLAGTDWSPILFPFLIGFSIRAKSGLPQEVIQSVGARVLALGLLVTLLAIASNWYPLLAIIAVSLAIIGREVLTFLHRWKEDKEIPYFVARDNGLLILGILPDSPAEGMALQTGELITKVNGRSIKTSGEMYEALQMNAAHCKLEVIDNNGQIRLTQRALYEGDHYELGIIVTESNKLESKGDFSVALQNE